MQGARWRWTPVLMAVLVAGCLPSAPPDLPASFTVRLRDSGLAFEVVPQPPADVITAPDVVARLAGDSLPGSERLRTRAVPLFGILSCTGEVRPCQQPFANEGDTARSRPVWLVVYPDALIGAGDHPDVVWALVDAVEGLAVGYEVHRDPRDLD